MTTTQVPQLVPERSEAWWHYPHVWMVIGLLTFAVAASFGLLYAAIEISRTDTVYSDPLHPQDGSAPVVEPHMLPAEEARNHATTGGIGAPHLKVAPENKPGDSHAPVDD